MPSRAKIAEYWSEHLEDGVDADSCFACGDILRLERAHIIPHAEGGSAGAENLHVLCKPCHIESELTGGDYWKWFEYKRAYDWAPAWEHTRRRYLRRGIDLYTEIPRAIQESGRDPARVAQLLAERTGLSEEYRGKLEVVARRELARPGSTL